MSDQADVRGLSSYPGVAIARIHNSFVHSDIFSQVFISLQESARSNWRLVWRLYCCFRTCRVDFYIIQKSHITLMSFSCSDA